MSYQLYLSLQGHPSNPAQVNFAGDTIVITSGTGAGETAIIQSYDAEQNLFVLNGNGFQYTDGSHVLPTSTSRFQIEQNLAATPRTSRSSARRPTATRTRSCSRASPAPT